MEYYSNVQGTQVVLRVRQGSPLLVMGTSLKLVLTFGSFTKAPQ